MEKTHPFTINLPKLIAYGNNVLGRSGELWRLEVSKLAGGYGSYEPHLLKLIFRLAENQFQTVPVVQKSISETEAQIMQALREVPGAGALPYVIDLFADERTLDKKDSAMSWLVTPFYEGDVLTFDDEIPAGVIETLARVHLHCASRLAQFDGLSGLHHVDVPFFRRTFHNALEALALLSLSQEFRVDYHKQLEMISRSSIFEDVLQQLPVTLVHGDVHPGNIIRPPAGQSVLIDWGNARIAPAMLDLANVVTMGSPNWDVYSAAWEVAGGLALDPDLTRQGYYWAVAMVNLQYLPFAAAHRTENVVGMVERILDARNRLLA